MKPAKKKKTKDPEIKVWVVTQGLSSRISWTNFPHEIAGYGEIALPEPGDYVHTIMLSTRTAVFRIVEITTDDRDAAVYRAKVRAVGFLDELDAGYNG